MSGPPLPNIGRYRLEARLGQGQSGVVYDAIDPDHDRHVAVKVMLPEIAQDAAIRQHFLREARAVARLRHRHLAVVYDVASQDQPAFVAMERLRGQTLAERLTKTPALSLVEGIEIVEQLCLGLQCAHEHGLVHRNVTPANIWLLDDGSVKLVDFGLPPSSAPTVTDTRALVGRIAYLSPEQIAARPVDGRSDLFAVGVVLFELVTGRRPFEADSITGIFDKVVNATPVPVTALVPPAAEPLQRVLERALAKDPAQRYPDALELAADLTLVRLALVGGALPVEAPAVVPETPPKTAPPPLPVAAYVPAEDARHSPAPGARGFIPDPQPPVDDDDFDLRPTTPTFGADDDYEVTARFETVGRSDATTAFDRLRSNPAVVTGALVAGMMAVGIGAWLALRSPTPAATTAGTTNAGEKPSSGGTAATPPAAAAEMRIDSDPSDAEVFVNGVALARTPTAAVIDRLRNAELRVVKAGYESRVVRVSAEDLARGELSIRLTAEAPPVTVSGSAPFEFEVLRGQTVISATAASHRFTVKGEQTLRVRALRYYLDRAVTIPAGRQSVTLSVPALGRLAVRVSPALERCRVSVGGRDFGDPPYPPVPYLPIVAGAHRVQLTCPEGEPHQEMVTIEAARDRTVLFR